MVTSWFRSVPRALPALALLVAGPAIPQSYDDGRSVECDLHGELLVDLGILDFEIDLTDEGWTWVTSESPLQNLFGEVTKVRVASKDSYVTHDSHDLGVDVRVDPGFESLVSLGAKEPDTIEIEWETGILPGDKVGDGAEPMLPRWAWPSVGDRIWAYGHWVYDCGHQNSSRYPTEIHPAIAIASMRDQARRMPGTGSTPVPITSVDLWIHGRGGFTTQQLYCGMGIIFDPLARGCPTATTPIAEKFGFDVCLPPRRFEAAELTESILTGPYNQVLAPDPVITLVPASDACRAALRENGVSRYDQISMAHVEVQLEGSGVAPEDEYARRIYLGWVAAPDPPLPHLQVSLERMDLHHDKELPGGDCECSFFWMNVDRSPLDEWFRLSDYAQGNMNNYDDDRLSGDGYMDIMGLVFDFYALNDRPFTIRANGYDQDCFDGYMGFHFWDPDIYLDCGAREAHEHDDVLGYGQVGHGDPFTDAWLLFGPPDYGVSPERHEIDYSDYGLDFTIAGLPLVDEDAADLSVTKSCTPDREVAIAGEPFRCTVVVQNRGPGLPRNPVVVDGVVECGSYAISDPNFRIGEAEAQPCDVASGGQFECAIGTVPVGGTVSITVTVTPESAGDATNQAIVSSDSVDSDLVNNLVQAVVSVFLPIEIDIRAPSSVNPVRLQSRGLIPVAVLTTSTFDAATINPLSVCFGDADHPAERDCTEAHGTGHVEDVDRDGDLDLLLHYETREIGIGAMNTTACLIGTTAGGAGVYGCDVVTAF